MVGLVVTARLDDRAHPSMQAADVTEQVGHGPLRTRRHVRVDAGRPRRRGERVPFAPDRIAVFAVVHDLHYGEATEIRSKSSGPLLSALFTSVDTVHASSSDAGIGVSSFASDAVS